MAEYVVLVEINEIRANVSMSDEFQVMNYYWFLILYDFQFFFLFQILTNGRYKSVEHRGMLGGACERLSLAIFYSPSMDSVIAPAADLVDETHPCLYEPTLFSDYMAAFYQRGLAGKNHVNQRLVQSK